MFAADQRTCCTKAGCTARPSQRMRLRPLCTRYAPWGSMKSCPAGTVGGSSTLHADRSQTELVTICPQRSKLPAVASVQQPAARLQLCASASSACQAAVDVNHTHAAVAELGLLMCKECAPRAAGSWSPPVTLCLADLVHSWVAQPQQPRHASHHDVKGHCCPLIIRHLHTLHRSELASHGAVPQAWLGFKHMLPVRLQSGKAQHPCPQLHSAAERRQTQDAGNELKSFTSHNSAGSESHTHFGRGGHTPAQCHTEQLCMHSRGPGDHQVQGRQQAERTVLERVRCIWKRSSRRGAGLLRSRTERRRAAQRTGSRVQTPGAGLAAEQAQCAGANT